MTASTSAKDIAEIHSRAALRRDALGLWQVVFLVISAAAPLTGMLGAVPPAISLGNGAGVPGAYVIAGLVLLVFSVGYASMSRHMVRAGAFYSYVAAGLGRPLGMAGAFVALGSYTAIQIALYGLFGFFCTVILNPMYHWTLPWYAFALAAVLMVQFTGRRGIDLNSKLLGLLMLLELGVLLLLSGAIVAHGGGPGGLTAAPFAPRQVMSGHPGIAIMFAFASFIGFEATAIYGKECREPQTTVPRATYLSVILILAFFAFVSWAIVCAYGVTDVATVAAKQPGEFWFIKSTEYLGGAAATVMSLLLLMSIFASVLSFHNTIVRYAHALSAEGILPAAVLRLHPVHGSPLVASHAQTASVLVALAAFVATQADPFNIVFSWMSALGTLGVVALQATTSFAVFAYFRRTGLDKRIWHAQVAPLLGGIGLLALGALLVANLDTLSGSDSPVVKFFPGLVLTVAALGVATALHLRRTRPEVYGRFGQ